VLAPAPDAACTVTNAAAATFLPAPAAAAFALTAATTAAVIAAAAFAAIAAFANVAAASAAAAAAVAGVVQCRSSGAYSRPLLSSTLAPFVGYTPPLFSLSRVLFVAMLYV
jgi:hypothetical protein